MIFQNQLVKSLKSNSDKTAIEYDGKHISYSTLLSDANRVAQFLLNQQLEKETVIGIDLKDRSKIIASIIGVANARCTFVLLDRSLPDSRMEHLVRDLDLKYLIKDHDTHPVLNRSVPEGSWLYDELPEASPDEKGWNYPEWNEEDSLYIYFTSGSTGIPKGIIGKNCSLLQFLKWEIDAFEISDTSRFSQLISPYFDAFLRDVFAPLLAGGTLCIPPDEEDFFSSEKLIPWINDSLITTIHCVPSLFRQINTDTLTSDHFHGLKHVLMSGEKINPSELVNWYRVFGDRIQLVNLYGATEATMIRTCYKIRPEDAKKSRMPIGAPIADTKILIAKKNMQSCGPLVPGDLYIVSNYLTKGYLNRPDLNQERFIKLNEGTPEETVAYKTGDKARKLAGGQIELLGREDRQVKLRGIRIELDEVEVTLMNSGLISNAVVILHEQEKESESLIAFLIKKDESRDSLALQGAIFEYMNKQVPAYMIPTNFVFVKEYPLLPNGKINLKELLNHLAIEREIVEPVNATEEKILAIWKEVLGEKSISTEDGFHQIGGNSLSLMGLIARINRKFQIRISLSELFKNPTIQKQAAFIETNTKVMEEKTSGIPVAPKADHYPLSASQNQLFFLHQFDPYSIAWNMPSVFKLEGELDKDRFQSVFEKLVAHHEILRTSYEMVNDVPVQRVVDQVDFEIEYYSANEQETDATIQSFTRPFVLSAPPLMRVGLLEVSLNQSFLMIDFHHLISDGASREIMIKEFMALYSGEQMPEAKLNFKDFTTWQQSEARKKSIARQSEFWLKQFSDEVEVLELPTDFPRPQVKSDEGGQVSFRMNKEETARLEAIADAEGVTMYMLMLSVFYVLLTKLSNQEDIVIGTPVAGRHHPDLENMVGMFVNGLCLRNQPEGDLSFKDFLASVKSNVLSCLENQDFTLDELIEALKLERDISRNPMFDVMFSFQNYEKATLEIPGLILSQVSSHYSKSKYDLSLFIFEGGGELKLDLDYATALYKRETIERFTNYYKRIISAITKDVNTIIADIEILSDAEKRFLLDDFNTTRQPEVPTVISMFKNKALADGEKTALVFEGQNFSYRELDEKSDRLANGIKKQVQREEALVGILMERSPELIVSIMGVLKAGYAYVPIDPEYPIGRIKYISEDSGLDLILTSSSTQPIADQLPPVMVSIDVTSDELYSEYGVLSSQPLSLSSTAYLIYTSGSTGHPKGVMISHGALMNYVTWAAKQYIHGEKSSFALYSSVAFDLTITSIFTPLITGNEIIIYQQNQRRSSLIEEVLERDEAEVIKLTPTHLKLIRDSKWIVPGKKNLKRLIVGGEELSHSLAKEVYDKLGGAVEIYNEYGPTEATVGCMIHRFDPEDRASTVPIGVPIDNVQIYILDALRNPVPKGVRGELYISGDSLAKGYISSEKLTSAKFLDNPYVPGQMMYKTGDLASMNANRHLVYKGRVDDQVKIRGYRIELGEIESQLAQHDQIDEVVMVVKKKGDDKLIIAYYLAEEPLDISELRAFLADQLPEYMLPSFYVHMESFPLTVNGKLDRKALPDPNIDDSDVFIAPANDIERKLVVMWAESLNMDPQAISVDRAFFELGGNSLTLMTLANKILKEFGVNILLKDVFTHESIRNMGALLAESVESEYATIPKAAQKPHYSLSQAQLPLFFQHELAPDSLVRNVSFAAELEGDLDKDKLDTIFSQLIARHDSLRTAFRFIDSEPVQVIAESVDFELARFHAKREEVEGVIQDFVKVFDLSQAPLFRAGLIEMEDQAHVLMIDVHHLVADGLSVEIIKDELLALYNGVELPALDLQYPDISEWQQGDDYLNKIEQQKDFWLKEFDTPINPLEVPLDYDGPLEGENAGGRITFEIDEEKTQVLKKIADSQGATLATMMLSIFNILLSKLARQEDIVVGIPLSGREQGELEYIVGMFAKALPVRNYPKAELSFEAFLKEVKFKFFGALDNQSYPYEELANELNIVRNSKRNPWFDVMFSFEHFHASEMEIPELKIQEYQGREVPIDQNLSLDVLEQENGLVLDLNYSKTLFREETAKRFVQYFNQITHAILEKPQVKISQIELVKEEEKQRLLFEFNGLKKDLNRDKVYSDLFKEQVDKTPDQIAVEHNGTSLTYRELHDRSVDLATYLASKGVNSATRVGIYMPRGIDMLVSILGILRTGSAYVPLDVHYPEKRTDEIVKDSQISLVITNTKCASDLDKIFDSTPALEELFDISQLPLTKMKNGSSPSFTGSTNDLVYMIYTSGTTGKPKGVMIHQLGMINHLYAKIHDLEIGNDDVIAQTASPCFDISVWQFLAALMVGGKTYVIDKEKVTYPDTLFDELRNGKVSIFESVPSLMTSFLDDLPSDHDVSLKELRWMVPTGEALSVTLAKKWYQHFPDIKLLNAYGPTEASDDVTHYVVEPPTEKDHVIPIGKPLANTRIFILNRFLGLCPIGVQGEICVAGLGVGKGYWQNEQKTSAAFVPNPLMTELDDPDYAMLYKTGDIGYFREDGNVVYIGRKDDQLKINGNRVELGEIESRLVLHDAIKEVAVLAKDNGKGQFLAAYYVSDEGLDHGELRQYLINQLPDYMVPAVYEHLDKMPLTNNGKLDRGALPDLVISLDANFIPAATETEIKLSEIWAEVLKISPEQVSVEADFFSLGGNSLMSITLVGKVHRVLNVKISLRDFFKNPTVRAMAEYIDTVSWLNQEVKEDSKGKIEISI